MKTLLLLQIGLMSVALGQDGPRGSYFSGDYEAARAKAKETGKPIAIVTTNLKSNCPKCLKGNKEVLNQMKSDYILVIDDDKANKGSLPPKTQQNTYPIYKSKGNIIPIVAVLSPEDDSLLGGLCYKQIAGDGRKAFETLETEIATKMAEQPAKAATSAPKTTGGTKDTGGLRDWTNSEGKTIRAEALSGNENSVTLKLENGKVVEYPLEKLSEASRKLVSETYPSD